MTEQERLAAALEYQQAQQPARMNPNLAAQGARGRENMMPPTSVMDERYPTFKRNQEDAEKLMLGLDIVGSAIPLAGPAVKGAKMLGQAAAPQLAQALENYAFKTGMALPMVERQAGRTFAAPQDEALRLAQQRAALPVSQGGLGLPKNNTAEQRAAAMGGETGWAHGSPDPTIRKLQSSKIGAEGPGVYATNYLPEASTYSHMGEGATIYPLTILKGKTLNVGKSNPYEMLGAKDDKELLEKLSALGKDSIQATQPATPQWLLDAGVVSMPERQHFVSQNADNFRSRFAAFDPFRRNAATAAAMGVAAPDLLAKEKKK